jgi:hypothetical protein
MTDGQYSHTSTELASLIDLEKRMYNYYVELVNWMRQLIGLSATLARFAHDCNSITATHDGKIKLEQSFVQTSAIIGEVMTLAAKIANVKNILIAGNVVAETAAAHCDAMSVLEKLIDGHDGCCASEYQTDYQNDLVRTQDVSVGPGLFLAIKPVCDQIKHHRDFGLGMIEQLNIIIDTCVASRNQIAKKLRDVNLEIATQIATGRK